MTLSLLISAAVLVRSVHNLQATNPGFDTTAVGARILLPDARKNSPEHKAAFARAVLTRAEQLPGVTAASIVSDLPFGNAGMTLGLQLEPRAPKQNAVARLRLVGPGYFKAMGIPLLSGRAFESADASPSVHRVIVSRAFAAQQLGTLDALGKKLSYREHEEGTVGPDGKKTEGAQIWYEIIGVAEDTLDTSMTQATEPLVYVHAEAANAMTLMDSGFAIVARGSGDPSALVTALTTIARDVDRDAAVYEVEVLGAMVEASYRQRTTLEYLLGAFALASVILAAIGLYGVTSYAVAERSGEIGIRRALGASRGAIVAMILKETAIIVGIGMAVGVACALSAGSLLASFLYGVSAADPLVYVVVCLGLGVVAMLAALAPARAASSVMPSRALEAT
jgi:predicted permease